GLVDIDNLNDWTTQLPTDDDLPEDDERRIAGPLVDLSSVDFPLTIVGRKVRGCGAASGWMRGEATALFYRYKSRAGFEDFTAFSIGPRPGGGETKAAEADLLTQPGDSGTLWLIECAETDQPIDGRRPKNEFRPLALQWGANRLYSGFGGNKRSFALATCLS